MIFLTALAFATQQVGPTLEVPGEVLRCGTDTSSESALCRAVIAQQERRYADSADAFEEAAGLASTNSELASRALVGAGNMWLAADQPERAATALDKALALNQLAGQQQGLALQDRARAALALGDAISAMAFVEAAEAFIAEDPFLWYLKAAVALRQDDIGKAKGAIARAIALAPDSPQILLEAAVIEDAAGNMEGARTYLEQARDASLDSDAGKRAAALLAQNPE